MTLKIDQKTQDLINSYIGLPYFNNRRKKVRGGLRVSKGKGLPKEIWEEAEIQAMQSRVNLGAMNEQEKKEFLVKNDLGVDCSGFAYHVLNSFVQEKGLGKINNRLSYYNQTFKPSVARRILTKFRPAENTGVSTFRNEANSIEIDPEQALPGDIIVIIGTGREKTYNHIMVITSVEKTGTNTNSAKTILHYAHSYAWPSDGLYNHGVREGQITLASGALANKILKADWLENGMLGSINYTYQSACDAKEVTVRRLKFLTK